MPTRTRSRDRRSDATDSPSNHVAATMERIQALYGKRDCDALRDEAIVLTQRQEFTQHYIERLSACLDDLQKKVDSLVAHEHYQVVVTGVEGNGSMIAEVAGLGNTRVRVAVHPDVDPEHLLVGATGLVSRERNCLLQLIAPTGRWRHVATLERCLTPGRILVKDDHGALTAIDRAHDWSTRP